MSAKKSTNRGGKTVNEGKKRPIVFQIRSRMAAAADCDSDLLVYELQIKTGLNHRWETTISSSNYGMVKQLFEEVTLLPRCREARLVKVSWRGVSVETVAWIT